MNTTHIREDAWSRLARIAGNIEGREDLVQPNTLPAEGRCDHPVSECRLIGEFQIEILQSVRDLRSEAFGANVAKYLEDKIGRQIHAPQVYAALSRLEDLGMVSSHEDEGASAGKRGRTRRIYQIEALGLRMLGTCEYGAEWRPIETAPKDGTWIWAFYPRKNRPQDEQCPARWRDDGHNDAMWWDAAEHRDDEQPTHWMPLPASPEQVGDRTVSAPRKTSVEPNESLINTDALRARIAADCKLLAAYLTPSEIGELIGDLGRIMVHRAARAGQ